MRRRRGVVLVGVGEDVALRHVGERDDAPAVRCHETLGGLLRAANGTASGTPMPPIRSLPITNQAPLASIQVPGSGASHRATPMSFT